MVLYQVCYFCADRKSKMVATGQLSLTLDPMGISFKDILVRNYSTNWIFCIIWMFLDGDVPYLIYYFGADRKSPGLIMCSDWLKVWRSSCQKLLSRWNCNIIEMMTGWSSTNLFIFVWIGNPKWPSPGNLFYHWTLCHGNFIENRSLWKFVLSCSSQKVPSQLTWFVPCCS